MNSPCYDEKLNKQCDHRYFCIANGRNKCKEWVKYEKSHSEELEAKYKRNAIKDIMYERNTHGNY